MKRACEDRAFPFPLTRASGGRVLRYWMVTVAALAMGLGLGGCGPGLVLGGPESGVADLSGAVGGDGGGPVLPDAGADLLGAVDLGGEDLDWRDLAAPAVLPGRYFFEVEYENFAWGYACSGAWIDAMGVVRTYEFRPNPDGGIAHCQHNAAERYTDFELASKYGQHPGTACTLGAMAVRDEYGLIAIAAGGASSAPKTVCADFGGITYSAYQVDEATGLYHRVMLRQRGDTWIDNTSPAAARLADWLAASCAHTAAQGCE